MHELKDIIITVLASLVTGLGGLLLAYLHSWTKRIKEKDHQIKEHKERICLLENGGTNGTDKEEKSRLAVVLSNLEARISKLEKKD